MSNHFSADNLKFPGNDRRLDLTDLFVFKAPGEHHLLHRHHPGTGSSSSPPPPSGFRCTPSIRPMGLHSSPQGFSASSFFPSSRCNC
jgi:hypothetical protein